MGKLFTKGYSAVREEKQRQDENRAKMGKQLWRFFLSKDGEEATVRFLTEEPVTFQEHTIKSMRGGKEHYENCICTQELGHCPHCEAGDRPSFKGAYLIHDKRPYETTDKDGKKKKSKGQVRLYVQGARVLSQLDRLSERYGLTKRDYTITRTGSGTSTTYMFDRSDDVEKLTEAEITNMLPEKLRESFDGTAESLYRIVEEQLEMMVKNSMGDSDDDDEDEEEEKEDSYDTKSRRSRLIGVDDDDEEDEEAPRSVKKRPSPPSIKGKRPKENSVKPLFRKKK